MNPGVLVNDVHSALNAARVAGIAEPASEEELRAVLADARHRGLSLSLCGSRHAMGGQQFGDNTLLLDTRHLKQWGSLDQERGTIEVGAGLTWPEIIAGLPTRQSSLATPWSIRQKQTGADNFTLGGSLAANIHGRGLRLRPLIDDIEAFTLVDAQGTIRRCSRVEHAELFSLAIGGYGCFGFVTSICLRLAPRRLLERVVAVMSLDELMPAFTQRIEAGFTYGDFQFSIDENSADFLHRGIFSCYRPVEDGRRPLPQQAELNPDDWERLVYLAHTDRTKIFDAYAGFYLSTHGQHYWSDHHQLSVYLDDYHARLDHRLGATVKATEMISELYVPRAALAIFMAEAAEVLQAGAVPLIYGTVRLIERDTESFLAWARDDFACIIFNLHTEHSPAGLEKSAVVFRALIDCALAHRGSYYLTYHRWARRDQVERAYPQIREFLRLKTAYDPTGSWQSNWWRHYRDMFAEP
jgi:FAD/FMN-containing dehydrogenase